LKKTKDLMSTTPSFYGHSPTEPCLNYSLTQLLPVNGPASLQKKDQGILKTPFRLSTVLSKQQMQQLFLRAFNGLTTIISEIQNARIDLASVENKVLFEFGPMSILRNKRTEEVLFSKGLARNPDRILNLFTNNRVTSNRWAKES
jgi:hypothetical protein